jgi:hypothetical protein
MKTETIGEYKLMGITPLSMRQAFDYAKTKSIKDEVSEDNGDEASTLLIFYDGTGILCSTLAWLGQPYFYFVPLIEKETK